MINSTTVNTVTSCAIATEDICVDSKHNDAYDSFIGSTLYCSPTYKPFFYSKEEQAQSKTKDITSKIKSVYMFNGNTIKIVWTDGTATTATCDEDDVFSFTEGIKTCILKYLLGNSLGNKAVNKAVKIYNKRINDEKLRIQKEAETKAMEQHRQEKKRASQARKGKSETQTLIEALRRVMQSEALLDDLR